MPLYAYRCACGAEFDRWLPLELYRTPQVHLCGRVATKLILPPLVMGDLPGYESPASGKWIEGRKARLEDLKRTGCRPYDIGEKDEMLRRQKSEETQFDRAVEETVEREITVMPARKREKLVEEVSAGADVAVVRSTVT